MKFFLRLVSLFLWFWAFFFTMIGVLVVIQTNYHILPIFIFTFLIIISIFIYLGIYLWKKPMKYNKTIDQGETAAERFERESEIPGSKARQQKLNDTIELDILKGSDVEKVKALNCPNCAAALNPKENHCEYCGTSLYQK
ncbi:hypothetical protein ACIP9G_00380 [Lysinibacillus sp. NPDC093197]|uniref:hypothetical protein n=1 Tax=Lysinibacillus sp. NPDC093197 TaxID=3364132 RepID=UPI0037FD18ED